MIAVVIKENVAAAGRQIETGLLLFFFLQEKGKKKFQEIPSINGTPRTSRPKGVKYNRERKKWLYGNFRRILQIPEILDSTTAELHFVCLFDQFARLLIPPNIDPRASLFSFCF